MVVREVLTRIGKGVLATTIIGVTLFAVPMIGKRYGQERYEKKIEEEHKLIERYNNGDLNVKLIEGSSSKNPGGWLKDLSKENENDTPKRRY